MQTTQGRRRRARKLLPRRLKGKAEDAQEAAETAQGKAEDAQEAAETAAQSAQTAAETAQGKAAETASSRKQLPMQGTLPLPPKTMPRTRATSRRGQHPMQNDARAAAQERANCAETAQGKARMRRKPQSRPRREHCFFCPQIAANTADIGDLKSRTNEQEAKILAAFPTDTAFGAAISFSDGADDIPVKTSDVGIVACARLEWL
jgi:hypothetical protein